MKIISLEVDVLPRMRPPPKNKMTSAYTQSVRDDTNLKTIVKDPQSIRATTKASVPTEKRTAVHTLSNASVWKCDEPRATVQASVPTASRTSVHTSSNTPV